MRKVKYVLFPVWSFLLLPRYCCISLGTEKVDKTKQQKQPDFRRRYILDHLKDTEN